MKDENFFFMKDPTKEENKQPIMKPYFFLRKIMKPYFGYESVVQRFKKFPKFEMVHRPETK